MKLLINYLLFVGIVCGCTSVNKVTTPSPHTDYDIGENYILKQTVYLQDGNLYKLGFNGTPSDPATFKVARPNLQLFQSGRRLKITRVQVVSAPEMGALTEVYAIPVDAADNREINITWISNMIGKSVFTGIDSRYLEKAP